MHLRIADGDSGTANIMITIGDASLKSTKVLMVKVGANGVNAIDGTSRADALFVNGVGATTCCAAANVWAP